MEETVELTYEEQTKLLEEFIFNNKELEQLENIVDKFNIFLSLGIINAEIRHSYFLGWILSPEETHGMGDYFLKLFLKAVVYNYQESVPGINIFKIDTWDFDNTQVLREWNNIDILIVDETLKFVCVIENKVDSSEHSNQLTNYRKTVESHYPDYNKLFIYLTVTGERPEKEQTYVSVSYTEISELIFQLLENKGSQLSEEITTFISHYLEMLKRFIMEESEVQEICEQIYKKHRKALDLIIKYKPDIYLDIKDALVAIIEENQDLILDHCSKSSIRFIPKALDKLPKIGDGWVPSKRILLFEIKNYDKAVTLFLYIGPGPHEIREEIFNFATGIKVFNVSGTKMYPKWSMIYKLELSKVKRLEGKSKDELKETLKDELEKFLTNDYVQIEDNLMKLKLFSDVQL